MNKYCKLVVFIIYVSVISGCYHLEWKYSINQKVGKNINDSKIYVTSSDNFAQAKQLGLVYKEVQESPNTRYYFNWGYHPNYRCQYSLLVDPDGTILSWDFVDYKKRKACYVY